MARRIPPGLIAVEDSPDGSPGIATLCGVQPQTVRHWRVQGRGPRTWRSNGLIVSSRADIDAYLRRQQETTARAAA